MGGQGYPLPDAPGERRSSDRGGAGLLRPGQQPPPRLGAGGPGRDPPGAGAGRDRGGGSRIRRRVGGGAGGPGGRRRPADPGLRLRLSHERNPLRLGHRSATLRCEFPPGPLPVSGGGDRRPDPGLPTTGRRGDRLHPLGWELGIRNSRPAAGVRPGSGGGGRGRRGPRPLLPSSQGSGGPPRSPRPLRVRGSVERLRGDRGPRGLSGRARSPLPAGSGRRRIPGPPAHAPLPDPPLPPGAGGNGGVEVVAGDAEPGGE